MKSIISIVAVLLMALTLSACTTTQKAATGGALIGAAVGGVTTGSVTGAAVGAAVGGITGAVAGQLLGRYRADPTQCVYIDNNGRRYLDDCPNG